MSWRIVDNKQQAEYRNAIENCKKLENETEDLQSKLSAAELEASKANEEKQLVVSKIDEMRLTMDDLEAKLEAADQEIAAAKKRLAEYDDAVTLCKKLEKDSKELQSKLEAVESEATEANEEKNRAYEAIAKARSQIADVRAKLKAAEEENAVAL